SIRSESDNKSLTAGASASEDLHRTDPVRLNFSTLKTASITAHLTGPSASTLIQYARACGRDMILYLPYGASSSLPSTCSYSSSSSTPSPFSSAIAAATMESQTPTQA
ncbi:hypothetical protein LTS18_005718, partial [Coniosporium uncinatum]